MFLVKWLLHQGSITPFGIDVEVNLKQGSKWCWPQQSLSPPSPQGRRWLVMAQPCAAGW